jgi:DNA-binding GntR family transcriptional regulator
MTPPSTRSPTPTALADQVYQAVKRMIFDFELLPGSRFSEAELTARLGVSRTPLRQALQRLQNQGFVGVLPKMGWFVSPIDFDVMDDLYDLRILLESHAVQRLAKATDHAVLQPLQDQWLVKPAQRQREAKVVEVMDEAFHGELVAAAANHEMKKVHQEVTDRIRLIRHLDFTKPERVTATYEEHGRILRAILERRSAEAVRLLKAHIEQSKIEVRKITLDAMHTARQRLQLSSAGR